MTIKELIVFFNPTQKQTTLISSRRGWEGKDRMSCQLPSLQLLSPSFQKVGRGLCFSLHLQSHMWKWAWGGIQVQHEAFFSAVNTISVTQPWDKQMKCCFSAEAKARCFPLPSCHTQEQHIEPHFTLTALIALITHSHSFTHAVLSQSFFESSENV